MGTSSGSTQATLSQSGKVLRAVKSHWLVALALVVGLVIGVASHSDDNLKTQLQGLRTRVGTLLGSNNSLSSLKASLESERASLQSENSDLNATNAQLT